MNHTGEIGSWKNYRWAIIDKLIIGSIILTCVNFVSYLLRTEENDEKTFTVIFHAILSAKFKMDDDTSWIVIRGEEPVFNGWKKGGKRVTIQ